MKNNCIIFGLCFILLGLAGCGDNYEPKDIKYEATPNVQSLNMFVGNTFQLRANPTDLSFTWTSSDEAVATVSSDGLVTAVGRGTADITARAGDIFCKVPVTAVVRIPLVDYTLNIKWIELAVGGVQEIKIIPEPTDANDLGVVTWISKDPEVATVSYAGYVKCIALGETEVSCSINGIVKTLSVKVSDILPFNGPHVLLRDGKYCVVVAADFDYGGKNKSWYDSDGHDGDLKKYRSDRGDPNCTVDIESGSSMYGSNLGWTNGGEWTQYSIDVDETGDYYFDCYVSPDGNSAGYRLYVDGVLATPDDKNFISWGGGWQNYRWYHSTPSHNSPPPVLHLTEGRRKVKFYFVGGSFNFSAIRLWAKLE